MYLRHGGLKISLQYAKIMSTGIHLQHAIQEFPLNPRHVFPHIRLLPGNASVAIQEFPIQNLYMYKKHLMDSSMYNDKCSRY